MSYESREIFHSGGSGGSKSQKPHSMASDNGPGLLPSLPQPHPLHLQPNWVTHPGSSLGWPGSCLETELALHKSGFGKTAAVTCGWPTETLPFQMTNSCKCCSRQELGRLTWLKILSISNRVHTSFVLQSRWLKFSFRLLSIGKRSLPLPLCPNLGFIISNSFVEALRNKARLFILFLSSKLFSWNFWVLIAISYVIFPWDISLKVVPRLSPHL